jgi:nicotinamide-nucleotide adenylyltransferase
MDDMPSSVTRAKALMAELRLNLRFFNESDARVRIIRTIRPRPLQPKTLYILDSSFNPPSVAHLALAASALLHPAATDSVPRRLLLLFSTHNADKAPSPASFEQRLAMMTIVAEDLSHALRTGRCGEPGPNGLSQKSADHLSIDIGLTKEPYYTDKSAAIMQSSPPLYPSNPTHVHLVGYDTLIRFCNPKYYPNHNPPLSALSAFFGPGHKLRVTQRPYDPSDASSQEFGTVEEQAAYLQSLKDGKLEKEGFERSWADQIDMVPAAEGAGVSSTRVRKAAKEGDWELVGRLCTEGVAEFIKSQGLYAEDASGKKMME